MSNAERASHQYPAVVLSTGNLLHVSEINGEWDVWLNTEAAEFDGLCLAVGPTREAAVADAVLVLDAALSALRRSS